MLVDFPVNSSQFWPKMFNPNYALFMSTEDGCTFQPNPNSSINLDDLNYFRFVGRIVGKAVTDGYLLDAHFTRSLYKHMIGIKVRIGSFLARP
jgi:E3 ubiquitin-protein ligase HUWE1